MRQHSQDPVPAPDTQVIGPVCVDINVDAQGRTEKIVGGAAICAAAAAASLGHRVEAVATVGDTDHDLLSRFPDKVRRVVPLRSASTSSIRNVYTTTDQERRTCSALAQADPLLPASIPQTGAAVQHLAGLMVGDYDPQVVPELASRGLLAVDMQGFLRKRQAGTDALGLAPFDGGAEFFECIQYLKVDTAEGEHLTGRTDRRDIAQYLFDRGSREVMVSNSKEIIVLDQDGFHACPLRPRSLVGRTGRGDTVFSAYITERIRHGADQALLTACATVSLKMETPGPLVCQRTDVEQYLTAVYADLYDPKEAEQHVGQARK